MHAAPEDQLRLLELAGYDAELDRLAHRRRTLPALALITTAAQEQTQLEREAVGHETTATDLGRSVRKLETDIEQVRSRAERDQQRLDAGSVSSARELENLQSEIASLQRRQASLEDELLELMEQVEQAESSLTAVRTGTQHSKDAQLAAEADRDAQTATIDASASQLAGQRSGVAAALPTELVGLYERLRADKGGVGAAGLVARRCEGCHLELFGAELGEVRSAEPDEVLRCEQCGRILVRTAQSGL